MEGTIFMVHTEDSKLQVDHWQKTIDMQTMGKHENMPEKEKYWEKNLIKNVGDAHGLSMTFIDVP